MRLAGLKAMGSIPVAFRPRPSRSSSAVACAGRAGATPGCSFASVILRYLATAPDQPLRAAPAAQQVGQRVEGGGALVVAVGRVVDDLGVGAEGCVVHGRVTAQWTAGVAGSAASAVACHDAYRPAAQAAVAPCRTTLSPTVSATTSTSRSVTCGSSSSSSSANTIGARSPGPRGSSPPGDGAGQRSGQPVFPDVHGGGGDGTLATARGRPARRCSGRTALICDGGSVSW